MKRISDLATIDSMQKSVEVKDQPTPVSQECCMLVDQIFIKFSLLCREYDALYADERRLNAEKLQWALVFTKHGLRNKESIQSGLDQTELHKYGRPPQLGQFIEWCLQAKKTKPMDDVFSSHQIESDEHKAKRLELGKTHTTALLERLRGKCTK